MKTEYVENNREESNKVESKHAEPKPVSTSVKETNSSSTSNSNPNFSHSVVRDDFSNKLKNSKVFFEEAKHKNEHGKKHDHKPNK